MQRSWYGNSIASYGVLCCAMWKTRSTMLPGKDFSGQFHFPYELLSILSPYPVHYHGLILLPQFQIQNNLWNNETFLYGVLSHSVIGTSQGVFRKVKTGKKHCKYTQTMQDLNSWPHRPSRREAEDKRNWRRRRGEGRGRGVGEAEAEENKINNDMVPCTSQT